MRTLCLAMLLVGATFATAQGTDAIFGRDFRVYTVPRLSGFTSIENPAVNMWGTSCCTNISATDKAAARSDLAAAAVEYVPLTGGNQCGALALSDHQTLPRLVGWSEKSGSTEVPCYWDSSSGPTGPTLPSNFSHGRFVAVNSNKECVGLIRTGESGLEQPAYCKGQPNEPVVLLTMPDAITINGSTYTPIFGRANWIDDDGNVVGTVYFDGTGGNAGERPVIWTDVNLAGSVLPGWTLTQTGQANCVRNQLGLLTVTGTRTTDSSAFHIDDVGSFFVKHCSQPSQGLISADWGVSSGLTGPHYIGMASEPFINKPGNSFTFALNAVTLPGSPPVSYATQLKNGEETGVTYFAGASENSANTLIGRTYAVDLSNPNGMTVVSGTLLNGGFGDLSEYDEFNIVTVKRPVFSATADPVIVEVTGQFQASTFTNMSCAVIGKTPDGSLQVRVDWLDWSTGQFVTDTGNGIFNACYSKYAPFAPSGGTFVQNGNVKVRIKLRPHGPMSQSLWTVDLTRVHFYANTP
ncbi:MAG: hypothetical protein JNM34_08550 [Chthonomonadaceae bacterium]|nr:hypothetical protein [Chthonomonadaceae bacterium]